MKMVTNHALKYAPKYMKSLSLAFIASIANPNKEKKTIGPVISPLPTQFFINNAATKANK